MNGLNTPQRNAFYAKYKKSDIFDDDAIEDKSQIVTKKVNSMKCAYQFKPSYTELTAKEQYQKEYWNMKPKILSSNSDKNLNNEKYSPVKYDNNQPIKKNRYSTKQQYIKEFFTNDIFGSLSLGEKNKTLNLQRSKSFFQSRSKTSIILENNQKINYKITSQLQKINSLASNIFNDKDKEVIVLKTKSTNQNTISNQSSSDSTAQKINKSKIPSVYDWKYTNIELGTKSHLIRSKTIDPSMKKQEELISHFDNEAEKKETLLLRNMTERNWDKTFFLPNHAIKSIDARPNRNLVQRFPQEKEVEFYEIYTNNNFHNVDRGKIKHMLQKKGLHIFKFEEIACGVNGYQSGKISFNLRKDTNDEDISRKLNEIGQEIKNIGLDMKKIIPDTHIKKERKATPGHLLKKSKQPLILTQNSMRNLKPQCNINYKNHASYQKQSRK